MELLNTCLITTGEFRSLALYSHLLPIIATAVLGAFVVTNAKINSKVWLFLLFISTLSLWLIGDLVTWHSNNYYLVAAFWSYLDFVEILFFLIFVGFFILQVTNRVRLPIWFISLAFIVSVPALVFTITGLSVGDFDKPNCEMVGSEFLALYKIIVEIVSILFIFILGIISVARNWLDKKRRNQILTLMISSVIFLSIFSSSEYFSTLTNIYEITLYALFTLPILVLILTFSIFEQKTFDTNSNSLTYARFLFSLFILVSSFNFVLADGILEIAITLSSISVTFGFGLLLLRSARREIEQRKEIEKLAGGLEKANDRLRVLDKQKSEFVSIASHQLRSPLTAIRGYVSLIEEENFGPVPEQMKDALHRVSESGKFMATSIDDFLNVSRIESGNMKYECKDVNLREQAEHIVDDLRPDATSRGLLLLFKSDLSGKGTVFADFGKTQQILHNLLNNALKYTRKGSVTVFVHDDKVKNLIHVEFIDTGIGMSQDSLQKLFGKFARAKVASSANIMGTGLGLFVAREMARAMKGDITAYSEGEGKGSRFVLTMPRVM